MKQDPEMLIPEFEARGKVYVNGFEIVSGKTAVSFADDLTMTVKSDDGTSLDFNVSLNCPQINRELPVLHFRPDNLINSKDDYVDTYIELYDKTPGSTGEGWWDSAEKGKIEMRGRGNSTWGLPKKPYRMKFSEKFSPIGLNHAKAIEANFTVWPFYYQYSGEAKMPAQTYEQELQRIRDLSAAREALLDNLFNR